MRSPPVTATTPWTLQTFYDALPRPFPEFLEATDAFEINALGWMNNMMQVARGGKLILSFFFTSDGPPGCQCLIPVFVLLLSVLSQCMVVSSNSIARESTKRPSSTPDSPKDLTLRLPFAYKPCPRALATTSGPSHPPSTTKSHPRCARFRAVWCSLPSPRGSARSTPPFIRISSTTRRETVSILRSHNL